MSSFTLFTGSEGCVRSAAGMSTMSPSGVERQVLEERGIDEEARGRDQRRVAVGRAFCNRFRADIAAGAGPVIDDELLAQNLAHLGGKQAEQHVAVAAGLIGVHHANDLSGVLLSSGIRRGEAAQYRGNNQDAMQRAVTHVHFLLFVIFLQPGRRGIIAPDDLPVLIISRAPANVA
jgi:hypothetical protein